MNTKVEAPETFAWEMHILMMDGKPFKCSNDPAEMKHFMSNYALDMPGVSFTVSSISSDHCHMEPPVGTRVTGSKGTVLEYGLYLDTNRKPTVGWHKL
jgi:hypothetical protein